MSSDLYIFLKIFYFKTKMFLFISVLLQVVCVSEDGLANISGLE